MSPAGQMIPSPLALFPLQTVLFPGGVLHLKVFEARYLDMSSRCMRSGEPFGVVCMSRGAEAGPNPQGTRIESVGVLAFIEDVDAEQAGILKLRCRGGGRFRLVEAPAQQDDGLWLGRAHGVAADEHRLPAAAMRETVEALQEAARSLKEQGVAAISEPLRLDDAGWVANRWCELLPLPLAAKQRLMELEDPSIRLQLVDEFLRSRQVLSRR